MKQRSMIALEHAMNYLGKITAMLLAFAFTAACLAQESSPQFRNHDKNNDGKLTRDELSTPLFDELDTDKNGEVTHEEDRDFLKRRSATAQQPKMPPNVIAELDVPYAATDNLRQRLDLYLPNEFKTGKPRPVVVFIHGGGWQNGDKRGGAGSVIPLVTTGDYIGVSIGYRLSGEAIWPAQIHDCKAAIRWLKANAVKYNLDPDRIGVTGTSAGGHLVAMLGTSAGVKAMDGELGDHDEISSRVACVIDQFGPTDFFAMGGNHGSANSPESKLVGGAIQDKKEAAESANPIRYVTADDPPFLFIHGTKDPLVPFNQSELLKDALESVKVSCLLVPVQNGGHGGFNSPEVSARIKQYFDKQLRGKEVSVSADPILLKR